jgi:hypothetical protein
MTTSKRLKRFLKDYIQADKQGDIFLESINPQIVSAFYDNDYVNSLHRKNDLALKMAFGSLYDEICWFLYDWKPGFEIQVNDVAYIINDVNDYIKYLVKEKIIDAS